MSTPGARDPRSHIRDVIHEMVRAAGGQTVIRPVIGDEEGWTTEGPDPLTGITLARDLEFAARGAVRGYVRQAREAGHSWPQIGAAMGYEADPEEGIWPADQAYRALTPEGAPFTFTCGGCGQVVLDYGPGSGDLSERERGHAGDCGRLARAVRAHDALRDEENERSGDGDRRSPGPVGDARDQAQRGAGLQLPARRY
jgi:photosystem II stability/assembly factor-like uncharacterized protein